jgi:fucose permease
MFIIKRYKEPKTQIQNTESLDNKPEVIQTIDHNQNTSPQPLELSSRTRILLIVLIAMSQTFYFAIESGFFGSSSTYFQFIPIHVSAQEGADLLTVMTTTYTVGRLVSVYISTKLKPQVMLAYHLAIIAISLLIFHFGQHSHIFLWIGNALIGISNTLINRALYTMLSYFP